MMANTAMELHRNCLFPGNFVRGLNAFKCIGGPSVKTYPV